MSSWNGGWDYDELYGPDVVVRLNKKLAAALEEIERLRGAQENCTDRDYAIAIEERDQAERDLAEAVESRNGWHRDWATSQDRITALESALRSIAEDPHNVYDTAGATSSHDLQYRIGVADGHRCAAEKARAALAGKERDQ